MRLSAHFGQWLEVGRRGRKALRWQVAAELIYGQVKKSYQRRKLVRVTPVMRLGTSATLTAARPRTGSLWTTQHCFHRAGESDRPSWSGSVSKTYLGHRTAVSTPLGPPRVVESILSFCASPRIATGYVRAAARAREQAGSATLPASYPCHGSRENQPTVDSKGSALLSHATSVTLRMLSLNEARKRPCNDRKLHQEDESRAKRGLLGEAFHLSVQSSEEKTHLKCVR
jgi:hypothetical protein